MPVAVVRSSWFLIPHTSLFPFRLKSSTPGFSWARHARWQVIPRAVLAFLCLDRLIIHVHVVLHSGHVLMAQQLLQAKRVVPQDQVAYGERMTENVRADALVRDASTLTNTLEEQADAIFRQGKTCLGEEQVILAGAAPFNQFLLTRSMAVKVVQKIAQAVVAERDASLLGAFALDDQEAAFAVKITQAQITQFAKPDAGIIEEPQDGAIPGSRTIDKWSDLAWGRAGEQEPFKLLRFNDPDERLAHLGEHDAVEGIALDDLAAHQPVKEGATERA